MSNGFIFKGQGRLQKIDSFVSRTGNTILTLIIETEGQYPQLVPIKVFGRLVNVANDWRPGSLLSVTGHLGGRKWNEKVYGDIIAEVVDLVEEAQRELPATKSTTPDSSDDDIPF